MATVLAATVELGCYDSKVFTRTIAALGLTSLLACTSGPSVAEDSSVHCAIVDGGCSVGCDPIEGQLMDRAAMCRELPRTTVGCVPAPIILQGIDECYRTADGGEYLGSRYPWDAGVERCEVPTDSWGICE